jgi:REP element-mobilizing transposase RayT
VTRSKAVHVTLRLVDGLPSLRRNSTTELLLGIFAAECNKKGFRLVHFAIRGNHLHLICEADGTEELSRGVQRLASRCARRLNERLGRRGCVFRDRFHDVVISSPRQMRNVLRYVLLNEHKDRAKRARPSVGRSFGAQDIRARAMGARRGAEWGASQALRARLVGVDHWSSAYYFDGFANVGPVPPEPPPKPGERVVEPLGPPVTEPHSWLLSTGWRRYGLIDTTEYAPRSAAGG